MKKILFATGNESKVNRFYDKLKAKDIEIVSLNSLNLNVEEPIEDGKDAISNAIIKAKHYYNITGMTTMAMDDNLFIENLSDELQPGLYVRRVNGKRLTDEEMIDYYSNLAKKYGEDGKLTARWVYGIAIIKDGEVKTYTWSKEDFYIVDKPTNNSHLGYPLDSISINKKLGKYFTDVTDDDRKEVDESEFDVVDFIINNI